MTDARRIVARAAYDGTESGHFFDLCYAVCAAMIDYDAAQPQPREEVVPHSRTSGPEHDKSAAPLVGADPPWLDEAAVVRLWRKADLPEYFLGNGGTNHKLVALAKAIVRIAVAHLTDDAVVEVAYEAQDGIMHRDMVRAALAAAGRRGARKHSGSGIASIRCRAGMLRKEPILTRREASNARTNCPRDYEVSFEPHGTTRFQRQS